MTGGLYIQAVRVYMWCQVCACTVSRRVFVFVVCDV